MLKIMISPAKKMNITDEYPRKLTDPVFLDRALELHALLKDMDPAGLKDLWKCSERLAEQNYERIHTYSPDQALTPALLSYEGLQYQHIAPGVFTDSQWDYAISHVRILSGFYGVLSPMDRVIPYRLEMQAKLAVDGAKDLYGFWGADLAVALAEGTDWVLDLASREYSDAVTKHLPPSVRLVRCVFGEEQAGRVVEKGTLCKMARGEMVRYMAETGAERPQDLCSFDRLGYRFAPGYSSENVLVFLRET